MTQIARPSGDVSAGSWTDEGTSFNDGSLFTSIRETSEDSDTSYILDAAANTTAEVNLTSVTDPEVGTGHIIKFWMRSSGATAPERCEVQLWEGGTQRATTSVQTNRSGTYAEKTYTLTTTEANNIGAYTDLRFKIIASNQDGGEEVRVTMAEFEVPDAPSGDLSVSESDGLTVGEADTLDPVALTEVNETQGVTLGETATLELVSFVSELDGLTVAEAVTITVSDPAIDVADNVQIVDVFLPYDSGVVVAETVTIAGLGVADLNVNVSDGLTLGEFVDLELISFVLESDGLTVGETVTVAPTFPHNVSDADGLTVGEVVTVGITTGIAELDAITLGEATTVTNPTDPIAETEGLTVGETVTLDPVFNTDITVVDAITVGDSPIVVVTVEGIISVVEDDNVVVGEVVTLSITTTEINVADGLTVGESVDLDLNYNVAVSDALTLGEAATITISDPEISVTDGLTLGEFVSVGFFEATRSITVVDSIVLGEFIGIFGLLGGAGPPWKQRTIERGIEVPEKRIVQNIRAQNEQLAKKREKERAQITFQERREAAKERIVQRDKDVAEYEVRREMRRQTSLENLELARMAREEEAKRQKKILAKRKRSLKKARAAKAKKAKK